MSTVLWANMLHEGRVVRDDRDKYALYKHSKKLDKLTRKLGVTSFLAAQDLTDAQFNLGNDPLPDGMESTDELMARSGTWLAAQDAIEMFAGLIAHIRAHPVKFGLFHDDRDDVLRELEESLELARKADAVNGQFNFSVVM